MQMRELETDKLDKRVDEVERDARATTRELEDMKRQRLEERIESRERIDNLRRGHADLKHAIQRLKDKFQTLKTDHGKDERSFAFEKIEHDMISIGLSRFPHPSKASMLGMIAKNRGRGERSLVKE